MRKEQVGMLHFATQIQGEEAIMVRVYRDGTVMRDGGGGLPPIFVQGEYRGADNNLFKQLLDLLPDALVEKPLVWQSPSPPRLEVDYRVLCYGQNTNGAVGQAAEWSDMSGLRVVFDLQAPPPNALVALADKLINAAKVLTNRLYFDMLVLGATGHRASTLPENTRIVALENAPDWLEKALARFVMQTMQINPNVKVEEFPKGKTYLTPDGKLNLLQVAVQGGRFSYRFIPA